MIIVYRIARPGANRWPNTEAPLESSSSAPRTVQSGTDLLPRATRFALFSNHHQRIASLHSSPSRQYEQRVAAAPDQSVAEGEREVAQADQGLGQSSDVGRGTAPSAAQD